MLENVALVEGVREGRDLVYSAVPWELNRTSVRLRHLARRSAFHFTART